MIVGAFSIDEADAHSERETAFWCSFGVFALSPVVSVSNEVEAGESVALQFDDAAKVGLVAGALVLFNEVDLAGEIAFFIDAEIRFFDLVVIPEGRLAAGVIDEMEESDTTREGRGDLSIAGDGEFFFCGDPKRIV